MKLKWSFTGRYDDGTSVAAGELVGFDVAINGASAVVLPATLNPSGTYELDLSDPALAAIDQTKTATYTIVMRTLAKLNNVIVPSVPSTPLVFKTDVRKPAGPFGLAIS
jgi:hypothetical protein